MTEAYCNLLYNIVLKDIIEPLTGNNTTYQNDLLKIGKKLLGDKFKGVYPSDKIPKLNKKTPYAILNLDNSNETGSHWVAIVKKGKEIIFYDSFGREDTKIIPNLKNSGNGKILNTDKDAEQKINEYDCGARCLSFLVFHNEWGDNYSMMI